MTGRNREEGSMKGLVFYLLISKSDLVFRLMGLTGHSLWYSNSADHLTVLKNLRSPNMYANLHVENISSSFASSTYLVLTFISCHSFGVLFSELKISRCISLPFCLPWWFCGLLPDGISGFWNSQSSLPFSNTVSRLCRPYVSLIFCLGILWVFFTRKVACNVCFGGWVCCPQKAENLLLN